MREPSDYFANPTDTDRTVFIPSPGGRGPVMASPPNPVPSNRPSPQYLQQALVASGAAISPLLNAADALLRLVGQVRGAPAHPDVAGLRDQVTQHVKDFEKTAQAKGASPESVLAARYILCALIDETVLSTPWGSESLWSRESLLSTFHNDTRGGENFFLILERASHAPQRNLDLLQLLFVCLSLGFEGKYRILERGRAKLEEIRESLFQTIRTQRGDFERELSPHWRGVEDRRNRLVSYVPLWVVAAFAVSVIFVSYLGFNLSLSHASNPVYTKLDKIGRYAEPLEPQRSLATVPESQDLRALLAHDIDKGLITFDKQDKLRIAGDDIFRSGRASVNQAYQPLLARIADALNKMPGQVVVTGHTDNVPIRSLRFRSNWDLSRARAVSIVKILTSNGLSSARLRAEGRADTQPLDSNDSPKGRARNRRVEITLSTAVGGA